MTSVVADLAAALRGRAVRVDVPSDLPPVDVDLVLISRVLTNLLENAVRHGPKNTPITIQARLDRTGHDSAVGYRPRPRCQPGPAQSGFRAVRAPGG